MDAVKGENMKKSSGQGAGRAAMKGMKATERAAIKSRVRDALANQKLRIDEARDTATDALQHWADTLGLPGEGRRPTLDAARNYLATLGLKRSEFEALTYGEVIDLLRELADDRASAGAHNPMPTRTPAEDWTAENLSRHLGITSKQIAKRCREKTEPCQNAYKPAGSRAWRIPAADFTPQRT